MPNSTIANKLFVLQAFDLTLWCPIAQALFEVSDLDILRAILGGSATDDPGLNDEYIIEQTHERTIIEAQFGAGFPPDIASRSDIEVTVFKHDQNFPSIPYLGHTGYELPLMLDGRKKLAKMYHEYPPMSFDGEEAFDLWVDRGLLHKEVAIQPSERPGSRFRGVRTAYYTVKGEDWRISATKLIWQAARQSGGWNEHFERLEGMLFGYEDWQNDWWIQHGWSNGIRKASAGLPLPCRK